MISYPPLDGSLYAVVETTRRERWWYSDGIWLDQGEIAAGVGFEWTHWLADRGVTVADAELGEDYARQLHLEAQRLGSGGEGPGKGARVDAAAQVLQARGLVEECYSFPNIDFVFSALLERGPVVAGIEGSILLTPTEVEGWMVGRPKGSAGGSSCVLLNGIALDLTIDGVTGFVRLKKCWGPQWGDAGHLLISIADLTATLVMDNCLLPIPATSALRPGVRQDVATEGLPYRPREVRFEQSSIGGDLATRRDTLGSAAYAEAIARGIQHVETKAPLTIGIKAAWGAGKTSLMRMIRDRLEWPDLDGSSEELRPIHLTTQTAGRVATSAKKSVAWRPERLAAVTNLAVLKKVRADNAEGQDQRPEPLQRGTELRAELGMAGAAMPPQDEDRWRPTVWFNPWMYQTGDQVWSGLANEIIRQVTERMTRGEQEHFWLHLNLKRVDEQAVRRKIYRLVLDYMIPYAIFGLVMMAAGILLLALGGTRWLGALFTLAGPAVVLAGGGVNGWRALGSRVSGGLSDLIHPATGTRRFLSGQLAGSYEEIVRHPDYQAQSGFLYLVHTDIQRVLDLIATPKRPLVIFVDDLDRCSPGTVVQVMEAINVFVAGAYPNSIFVIAMEPEMVAAHIEAVYADVAQKLQEGSGRTSQAPSLGWRFLEKIVQLPLAMPAMEPATATSFFESLFPTGTTPLQAPTAVLADGNANPAKEMLRTASLSEAVGMAADIRPDTAVKRELRRVIERRLTVDDPEMRDVIAYASQCLQRNPREIKRFVNLFRFYTMIYAERKLAKLTTPASLYEVAKLAVLGIRWPSLLSTLALSAGDNGTTVYELLESSPDSGDAESADAALEAALKAAGLSETMTARLMTSELKHFLRSEPKVGSGIRGYL